MKEDDFYVIEFKENNYSMLGVVILQKNAFNKDYIKCKIKLILDLFFKITKK